MAGSGYQASKSFIIPNQIVPPTSAPSLSTSATGGTLVANNYYVKYTWVTSSGETLASPEASITTTGSTSTVTVTIPTLPAGVSSANIYISTTISTETKQGNTVTTTFTLSAAPIAGVPLPINNTSAIQDLSPSALGLIAGSEFIIHNIFYDNQLQIATYDGVIQINFDSDTTAGAREGRSYHCNANQYIRVTNPSTSNSLRISFDGMQTV